MPTSIDPQPADDELECANCGAYFHYDLNRCPNCGVNIYEPDEAPQRYTPAKKSIFEKLDEWFHSFFNKPYAVDELFGAALNQADLFDALLRKVGGDRNTAERLIEYERTLLPNGSRLAWIKNAIARWERDNRR